MPRLQLSQRSRVVFSSETSTEAVAMIAIRGPLHPGTSRGKWPNWSAQVTWLQQRVVEKSYVWSAYSSKFSKMVHCLAINCTNSHRKGKPLPKWIRIHNIPLIPYPYPITYNCQEISLDKEIAITQRKRQVRAYSSVGQETGNHLYTSGKQTVSPKR